jgi:hypothetical protein
MTAQGPRPQIDTSKPHPARIYDYLLGGKDHYLVDEELAKQLPPEARGATRQNREFMRRAVAWVADKGVDQFLDIGTGIPTEPNLHQVAQKANPASRIVYVDNDPIVLRHAEALLVGTPEGATDYVEADVRQPEIIIEHARRLLDFRKPVCLSLVALMHFIRDEENPYDIVDTLVDVLAPGSYLLLSHVTLDLIPDGEERREAEQQMTPYTSHIAVQQRSRAQLMRFFEGLELLDPPGLVGTAHWYPDARPSQEQALGFMAGVARIP